MLKCVYFDYFDIVFLVNLVKNFVEITSLSDCFVYSRCLMFFLMYLKTYFEQP